MRAADDARLRAAIGSLAGWLRRLSHGDDPREVKPDRPWKSISAEDTYPEDLERAAEMRVELERLAARVAQSLREEVARRAHRDDQGALREFHTVTRSHTEEHATRDASRIAARAVMLLDRTDAGKRRVRLLGVGVHGLSGTDDAASRISDREPELLDKS